MVVPTLSILLREEISAYDEQDKALRQRKQDYISASKRFFLRLHERLLEDVMKQYSGHRMYSFGAQKLVSY